MKYEPADIVIYLQNKGIVLKEKSLLAYEKESGKILAVGTEVEKLTERMSEDIVIGSPLRQGMVVDYIVAEKMFANFLRKAWEKKPLIKPKIAICVPNGIEMVEKKAIEDIMYQAGAREVFITDIPIEQFIKEMSEKYQKQYHTVIGITKDEPEKYIKEQITYILKCAKREGVSAKRVEELLLELSEIC